MVRSAYIAVLWLLGLLSAGCDSEPFQITAPAYSKTTGAALVSVQVPPFTRGLIHRVRVTVTTADTSRLRAITRDLNFPIAGGSLAAGQIAEIVAGKRRFTVVAFDTVGTGGVPRFRGAVDSTVRVGETQLVQVSLKRVGGRIDFEAIVDTEDTEIGPTTLADLKSNSVLDIVELVPQPYHTGLAILPLVSIGLADRYTTVEEGVLTRQVTVDQVPTGRRQFVAYLKDLSSGRTRAFADTISGVAVDTATATHPVFELERVEDPAELQRIFTDPTLPPDSTIVVVPPHSRFSEFLCQRRNDPAVRRPRDRCLPR